MTRRRWLWITLSIALVVLLGTLATIYNVALVQDYHRMTEYARRAQLFASTPAPPGWKVGLGITGFVTALVGVIIFMLKVLHEMKLNQLQSEFIAHVSHELKTPIATLELTSGLLRSEESAMNPEAEAERRQLWNSHDEELIRLKRQVEDLLEAARWQAGPPKRDPIPMNLGKWIQETSPRWRALLGPESQLLIDGDPLDFAIAGDPQKMELIFNNLMDNARKFALASPRVHLFMRRTDHHWMITLRDEGRGFPPQQSRRIFARFHRAPHGASHAIPGSGLGLHLCDTAARSLGWRLSALSAGINQGAEFQITGRIPRA